MADRGTQFTPPPGTYQTMRCPQCRGEPMKWEHDTKPDRVVVRVSYCSVCGGSGIAIYRLVQGDESR